MTTILTESFKIRTDGFLLFMLAFLFASSHVLAQTHGTYPRVTGYVGIVHPLVTFNKNGSHPNFKNSYVGGLPAGINIWKSEKIGFSMEVVPFISADKGTSRMNNFLFHPGVLLGLGNGLTLVGRAAFETSGRYGVTPVLNKVIKKNKNSSYFIAIPIPARFGNNLPASVAMSFQFGIGF